MKLDVTLRRCLQFDITSIWHHFNLTSLQFDITSCWTGSSFDLTGALFFSVMLDEPTAKQSSWGRRAQKKGESISISTDENFLQVQFKFPSRASSVELLEWFKSFTSWPPPWPCVCKWWKWQNTFGNNGRDSGRRSHRQLLALRLSEQRLSAKSDTKFPHLLFQFKIFLLFS